MDSESGSEDEMDTQDVMEHGYACVIMKKKKRPRHVLRVNLMRPQSSPLPTL